MQKVKIAHGGQVVLLLFLYIKYSRNWTDPKTLLRKRMSKKKRNKSDENHEVIKTVACVLSH